MARPDWEDGLENTQSRCDDNVPIACATAGDSTIPNFGSVCVADKADCPVTEFKIMYNYKMDDWPLPDYVYHDIASKDKDTTLMYTKGPDYFYRFVINPLQNMTLAYGMPCAFND